MVRIGVVTAAALAALTLASSASAEVGVDDDWEQGTVARGATLASPTDEAVPPGVARVASVAIAQDLDARTVAATVTFATPPVAGADAALYVYLGTSSSSKGCQGELALAGAGIATQTAGAFIVGGTTTPLPVTRSAAGTTLTLTTEAHDDIRNNDWDCAFADVRSPDGATRYQVFPWVDLEPRDIPVLQLDAGDPMQGAYAGAWATVTVDIRNHGAVDAPDAQVALTGPGLAIKQPVRRLGTLDDRRTKYGVKFLVRLTAPKPRTLTITATAPGARSDTIRVKVVTKPRPSIPSSVVGRAYWGSERSSISDSSGWRNHAVYFASPTLAYVGFSDTGAMPRCRAITKACRPYAYDARSGTVRLAGQRFKVTSEGFEYRVGTPLDDVSFSPLTIPKPGHRFAADLVHQDWSGVCLISCTSTTERIEFTRAGRFVRSRSSIGSWPGLDTVWSTFPPNQRGDWNIISTGVVELRYADGSVKRHAIAFDQDILGRPDPVNEGVLLGGTNFYAQS